MKTKYVINVVNLIGDKTRIFEMLEEIKRDELGVGSVDFNKVIPVPVDGSVSDHWYLDNWGTCQNTVTYMDFNVYEPVEIAENIIEIAFETIANAALPIVAKMADMNQDLSFVYTWAEDTLIGNDCGRYIYVNGTCVSRYQPSGKEAVLFSCEVWDVDPEEIIMPY